MTCWRSLSWINSKYFVLSFPSFDVKRYWFVFQVIFLSTLLLFIFSLIVPQKTGVKHVSAPKNSKLDLPFDANWYDTHHHCSGIVFATPDFSDVYVSHVSSPLSSSFLTSLKDTWTSLSDLNRIVKDYDFVFSNAIGGRKRHMFSSSPGRPLSIDDFFQLDNNLVVIETTLHNWNNELYEKYCSPASVFTWIRVQVANR
jgi:hypothetical protein